MTGKRLMNISGTAAALIPYEGGPSRGIPAKDGMLPFVAAEESIFLSAKPSGHRGEKLTKASEINGQTEIFRYRDGAVVHCKVLGGGHGSAGAIGEKILCEFLMSGK
jgi:hypothetical protein